MELNRKLVRYAPLAAALSTAGCTVWVDIKPSELPKVGHVLVAPARSEHSGSADVVAINIARVERTDGRLLEVTGKPDARVTCGQSELTFEYPVVAETRGSAMTITSSNYAPFTCEMGDLKRAQVVDEDATRTRTMFVSIGAIVASTAAVLAGVVAVAPVPH